MAAKEPGSAPRVLVVDNEEMIRLTARIVLELDGLDVIGEARSGEEALSLCRQLKPDVIVLDYRMPGVTGAETAEAARAEVPGVRVIGFSASNPPDEAWSDAFLPKTQITQLPALIRRVADGAAAREELLLDTA